MKILKWVLFVILYLGVLAYAASAQIISLPLRLQLIQVAQIVC